MTAWLAVIGAIAQIALLLIQSYNAKDAETKQVHTDNAKEITDAIASGDLSRINAVVQRLRS